MADAIERPSDFEGRLVREVDRVLGDPAFLRAPILRKLLQYLRDETIRTAPGALSQFAIAVDGLGRNEDYDKAAESYPRVQVSRLRKALADYYTRNLPGEGICVFIRHGGYALHLAPLEIAYPDLLASRMRDGQVAEVHEAGQVALAAAVGAAPTDEGLSWLRIFNRVLLVVGLLVIATALFFHYWTRTDETALTAPPRIALNVGTTGFEADITAAEDLRAMVESEARNAITFSPFSRIGHADDAQYVLNINLIFEPSGKSEIYMNLSDANARVIFKKSFPIEQDKEKFLGDVSTNMGDIFSSNGLLSREIFKRVKDKGVDTDFECFVLTEADYSKIYNIPVIVHQCIDRFPDSPLSVYWYTRTGFIEYIKDIRKGVPVRKEGPGWDYLQKALEMDRFNAYANALSGRVEVAQGDCRRAQFYFGRTLTQAYIYRGLQTTVLAEQYPCLTDETQRQQQAKQVEQLIANNQDPDPPLKLYLMLAALVIERRDLASEVAEVPQNGGMRGYDLPRMIHLVSKALGDPGYACRKRDEIQEKLAQYLWNPVSRASVMHQLCAQ